MSRRCKEFFLPILCDLAPLRFLFIEYEICCFEYALTIHTQRICKIFCISLICVEKSRAASFIYLLSNVASRDSQ